LWGRERAGGTKALAAFLSFQLTDRIMGEEGMLKH